ncbi:MAG: proline reductase-associated electron transfer protein PrdC [Lachnospiraceae bacterium]
MKYKILLKQHIGAVDTPVVAVGDTVKKGALLAKPNGLGAFIHAPFSGIISEITDSYLIIDASNELDSFVPLEGTTEKELVAAAGIVGMGGAGFPTAVKCNIDLKGGYILVNAAECEPLLHHNIQQIETSAEKTLEGLKIVMRLCNAAKAVFAIKEKHGKAVEILNKLCSKEASISVHLLPDLYPMGEERAVVREVLGKLLPPTSLPSAADAVVINVETVLRVAEAVIDHRPCISKHVSVAGKLNGGTHTRVFFDVPIGTTVGELIEKAGGIDGDYGEIIMGGPFTGHAVTLDTPISKTTGGILVTQPFPDLQQTKLGLLLCACGGNLERMQDLAQKMNGQVALVQQCKQAVNIKGTLKCENPGNCPGQAQKCLNFKKAGCTDILIGNCSDCTNTVMGSAPKLGLQVHHQTDHVFDTVGMERIRYLTKSKKVASKEASETAANDISPKTVENSDNKTSTPVSYHFEQSYNNGILTIDIKEGKNIYIELPF